MTDDLISRTDAIKAIHREARIAGGSVAIEYADMFQDAIEAIPSAQPKIVRCKECKWYNADEYSGIYRCYRGLTGVTADDFCSYGEREGE